jgi:hypothetical protein
VLDGVQVIVAVAIVAFTVAAPQPLLDNAVRCACLERPIKERATCAVERGPEVRKMASELYEVGQELTLEHGLPPWAAWWPVAQACRESQFRRYAIGDKGKSVGALQLQGWAVERYLNKTGKVLDRTDVRDSAWTLLGAVAWSYHERVVRQCPKFRGKSDLLRFRMAAARVGRGPLKAGRQRCDFWVWSMEHQAWRETAGITAEWARKWMQGAR